MARGDPSDAEWEIRTALLPPECGRPGRPPASNRRMLDGILWWARNSVAWRAIPEWYGNWSTIWRRWRGAA
jgi:transposase